MLPLTLALLLLLGAAPTPRPSPVVIGGDTAFYLRRPDRLNGRNWSVQDRVDHLNDQLAGVLGSPGHTVSAKRWGNRMHLYVDGRFILAVTPADAAAAGVKSVPRLAFTWKRAIEMALVRGGAIPPR